jgi:hypothetical protein
MTSDKLEDLRRAISDTRRCGAKWFKLHVQDAEELAASVWPDRPGIRWRARVQAQSRQVDG